ncbi:helix-turn-helix transcriptional regulator [Streptomyces cinnamoneus]|uniref:helix-turn-helix domain-containing protein n=1 Tax=Streptomyces cinnamoneus TaxID=53446 RepID=UPI0033D9DFE1
MSTEPTIGDNLARLRRQAGLTQRELAGRSGVGLPTIRGLECNARTTALMGTLAKLARALDVKPSVLLGQRQTLHQDDAPREDGIRALRRAVHPLEALPGLHLAEQEAGTLTVADLRGEVELAWQRYWDGALSEMIGGLPAFLAAARTSAEELRGDERRSARAALARGYQAAAWGAVHLGQDDLARTAVERSLLAAQGTEDAVLIAGACNALAWVLMRQGENELVATVATTAADQLNPRFAREHYQAVRMYGRLTLSAMTAAARLEDYTLAHELLATAKRCTTIVDTDATDLVNGAHHAAFGPSLVTMVGVELAMAQEKPDEALRLAQQVPPTRRIPPVARGRHLLDVAQAHTWDGRYAEAVHTLTKVHAMAPEWMRYQVHAREVVRQIQESKGRRRLPGLAPLARHMNLLAA